MEQTQVNQGAHGVPADSSHYGVPPSGQPVPQGQMPGAVASNYGPEFVDTACPRTTRRGNPCKNEKLPDREVCFSHVRSERGDS